MIAIPAVLPRACPRCRGRLLHARDAHGAYSSCVCCGFVSEWICGPAIDLSDKDPTRHRRREPKYWGKAL